jgi:hypothetical protein
MTASTPNDQSVPRRQARWWWLAIPVALVALAWWFLRTPPDEGSARADAAALSTAVADYVVEHGGLPRVTVTAGPTSGADVLWGEDFLVESRQIPRADPTRARVFFVVGDPDRWCVEMLYTPPGGFSDASPSAWVSVRGERGEVGRVVDGRCGDYLLVLSPVTQAAVPESGSIIEAATAPIGTCLADPFTGQSAGGDVMATGSVEVVACEVEHFGEIYHSGETSGDGYGQYQDAAAETCGAALSAFVGVPGNFSALYAEPFTVGEERWQAGDRRFSCVLFLGSENYPMVGSARDSWR